MSNSLVSVNNGALTFEDDGYGHAKTLSAYVCTPDRKIQTRLRGITSFEVSAKGFNDYSSIYFDVTKYVTNQSTYEAELNEAYNMLHAFCLVYVPEFGKYGYFLINAEPTINAKGRTDEHKTFTAYSYETILQYENLVGFEVNQGTTASLEMFEDNLDALGIPQRNIQLYDENDSRYSLLDLVLTDDYYGWSIGHVDDSLKTLQRSFSADNQNVLSFLCGDVSTAFQCIFTFDTVDRLINCYAVATAGENTNIYLSLDHFLSEIDITPQKEEPVTVFNVAGGNNLGIERVNFGSQKVINVTYPLSMLGGTLLSRYKTYVSTRNSLRSDYSDAAKRYAAELQAEQAILDRQPEEVVYNNWSSTIYYPTEDLQDYLQNYQAACTIIEGLYTTPQGEVDWTALDASTDAALYHSYHDVCIPDIQAELDYRETGVDYTSVDPEIVWQMYGLNDLTIKRTAYLDLIASLEEQGYDDDAWDESKTISEDTWIEHHNEYLTYQTYVSQLNTIIAQKEAQIELSRTRQDSYLSTMQNAAEQASLDYQTGRLFTAEEVAIIKSLYREADYQNENILITEIDDETAIIAKANDLLSDAEERLEIESTPQFSWSISSANLFAMQDFKPLRHQLQVGSFVNVYYGGSLWDAATESFLDRNTLKFRVLEIDFDGINFDGTFTITFSNMTQTKAYRNDLENLLGTMISSKTNSIVNSASSSAASTAATVAASMIRPYIEVLSARIQNAEIDNADVINLYAYNAEIQTMVTNYLEANMARIFALYVDRIESDDGSSWWDLRTGDLCLNGYMINARVEYAIGNSTTTPPASGWVTNIPTVTEDNPYLWTRTSLILDGNPQTVIPGAATCISAGTGRDGEDAIYVRIDSTAGNIFKNNNISTILTCTVFKGATDITSQATSFTWRKRDASGAIDPDWTRTISGNSINITSSDVTSKAVFECEVSFE